MDTRAHEKTDVFVTNSTEFGDLLQKHSHFLFPQITVSVYKNIAMPTTPRKHSGQKI